MAQNKKEVASTKHNCLFFGDKLVHPYSRGMYEYWVNKTSRLNSTLTETEENSLYRVTIGSKEIGFVKGNIVKVIKED